MSLDQRSSYSESGSQRTEGSILQDTGVDERAVREESDSRDGEADLHDAPRFCRDRKLKFPALP